MGFFMGFYGIFMVIQWDINGIYPPVNKHFAIEDGHFVRGFYPLIAW
jgi:hypothetical protein